MNKKILISFLLLLLLTLLFLSCGRGSNDSSLAYKQDNIYIEMSETNETLNEDGINVTPIPIYVESNTEEVDSAWREYSSSITESSEITVVKQPKLRY